MRPRSQRSIHSAARRVDRFHGPTSRDLQPRAMFGEPSRASRIAARILLALPRVAVILAMLAVVDYVLRHAL